MPDLRTHAGMSADDTSKAAREREEQAVKMRADGKTYDAIAEALGYAHASGARGAVSRFYKREAESDQEQLRDIELTKLQLIVEDIKAEIAKFHPLVQYGKVVFDWRKGHEKEPLEDFAPKKACWAELRACSAEMSRLRGLYAPQRLAVEVVTEDMVEQQIRHINLMADELERELLTAGINLVDS